MMNEKARLEHRKKRKSESENRYERFTLVRKEEYNDVRWSRVRHKKEGGKSMPCTTR